MSDNDRGTCERRVRAGVRGRSEWYQMITRMEERGRKRLREG